ncbi:MAG: TIGR03118 family protein [Actinobacteria bacterium]|nr:MAG: TIGR03118 family protein [Actinomycetota bacterium]
MQPRSLKGIAFAAALVTTALALVSPLGAAEQNAYVVTNLVSSGPAVPAAAHDASLVNGWGLTASSSSPWWVADNGANVSTLYNGNTGAKLGLTVTVLGGPTGTVFNIAGAGFAVPSGSSSRFLFASEDGKIRGWPGSGDAQETAAQSPVPFAKYKGLAIAVTRDGPRLYATDFHNGRVDVWDSSWNLITSATFTDPSIPAGYGPFGIQRIGETIFVTYAKQDADAADELHGQGLGFVDAYDTSGNLLGRVAQHGQLNAPRGLALAPASFGRFGGDLLVGNFGDGQINAYAKLPNGQFEHRGELRGTDGKPLAIDGLWALEFGNDGGAGPSTRLFFTAGPNDEQDGLFGSIDPN